MKHTPGPWRADYNEIHSADGVIAHLVLWRERNQIIADAALIETAPELLEALIDALEAICNSDAAFCQAAMEKGRAAIKKAIGK